MPDVKSSDPQPPLLGDDYTDACARVAHSLAGLLGLLILHKCIPPALAKPHKAVRGEATGLALPPGATVATAGRLYEFTEGGHPHPHLRSMSEPQPAAR